MDSDYKKAMNLYIEGLDIEIKQGQNFIEQLIDEKQRMKTDKILLNLRIINAKERNANTIARKEKALKEL